MIHKQYWLSQNMMYSCTHLIRVNKLNRFLKWGGFGYKMVIAECWAPSDDRAKYNFREMGHIVGFE